MTNNPPGDKCSTRSLLITIDGPAGAGKSTVSRSLANKLGLQYIDTGALYRGVAYHARAAGIDAQDNIRLKALCSQIRLSFARGPEGLRLMSGDLDITDFIRTPEITFYASRASAMPSVRSYLLELQRELGKTGGVVFEGRDMGTVVFPDADVKFFLDAAHSIRAQRRYNEMRPDSGQTLEAVSKAIQQRDEENRSRTLAPLIPAADAVVIDSTALTIDAVLERMLEYIHGRR